MPRTPMLVGMTALLLTASIACTHPPGEDGVHEHHHGARHERVTDATRFITDREGAALDLPSEENSFFFVVFGDRTGGRPEGVRVLEQAVRETNLLEPDLVMTVGDLIQGYNQTAEWMAEMREFKGVMNELLCPWFPVAGNHDVYWRGPNKPEGEHEKSYEMHFGPLWYAFEHKDCWFIVLYSDEGNPENGVKRFDRASSQTMSPEQFAWLDSVLQRTTDARHVFVFLHHPRWLRGGYGNDWDRVHARLAAAGNVRAVFAGHIHRMRYDGPRDGIEYVTLATTGGNQSGVAPDAGYLHHFHVVTVRDEQIALASLPVGEVMDVRALRAEVGDDVRRLAQTPPTFDAPLQVKHDASADGTINLTITNPVSRPIDVTLAPQSEDSRWTFWPDHDHAVVAAGGERAFTFRAVRSTGGLDESFRTVELDFDVDYLAETMRYTVPQRSIAVPMRAGLQAPARPADEQVLITDGVDDCLALSTDLVPVPNGPLTVECWFNADQLAGRNGVFTKTENSEYGLFINDGVPSFSIFIGRSYLEVKGGADRIGPATWHHLAGVYDGEEARLYIDGQLITAARRRGPRRLNQLPLLVGADVDGTGNPMSFFDGQLDGVRLSTVARYSGETFTPARRVEADDDTVLLLNMDAIIGPWTYDESGRQSHPLRRGGVQIGPARD